MPDAWAGPFTEDNLRRVIDSPARQQLVKRLSQGATAVFLFLPGQDTDANAKAGELLDKELTRLGKIAQLPELRAEDQLRFGVPLKIDFVMLKLKRDDPAEQAFIKSLLNTEEDLSKVSGPIVLPVFGRGRLLCSLFGEDLTRESLANVVRFICGECSCQVKELNPGVDLLIAADWLEILDKSGPPMPPTPEVESKALTTPPEPMPAVSNPEEVLVATAPANGTAEPNVVVPPSIPEAEVAECSECPIANLASHFWLLSAVGVAGFLVIATGIWVFAQRK